MKPTLVLLSSLAFAASLFAASPRVAFDTERTPLQKAIQKANRDNAARKKEKLAGEKKDRCAEAIDRKNDAALKDCDAGSMTVEKVHPVRSFSHPNGRPAGKRLVTKTKIVDETPKQKASPNAASAPEKWPGPQLALSGEQQSFDPAGASRRSRGADILPATGLSVAQRDEAGDGIPDEDPPDQWLTSPFAASQLTNLAPYTTRSRPSTPSASPATAWRRRRRRWPHRIRAASPAATRRISPSRQDHHLRLTTMGRAAGCAYRAVPTAVPMAWTTAPALSPLLPESGLLTPLGSAQDTFALAVPHDWAGMGDTTYEFRVTIVSRKDPETPKATENFTARHTVVATKESMTRYIGLEIEELIATLTAAENAGVKLGGLKPIAVHPIRMMNASALEAIPAGNFARASNNHATSIQLVQAFVKALDGGGKGLPAPLFADLHKRAAAMLKDLAAAEASTVTSK